ncbi:hypothetical protein, partial [Azospirillum picis]|uniref:hypothetical protein n=1 Tax=Azospirillum picis TaxID=488438 RepID=UPI001AE29F00
SSGSVPRWPEEFLSIPEAVTANLLLSLPFSPPAPRFVQRPAVGGAVYRRLPRRRASAFLSFDEKFLTVRFSTEPVADSV